MGLFSSENMCYGGEVDITARNSPHAELVRLVGENKHVLEVGPGIGHVSKVLKSKGCNVVAVELSQKMGAMAEAWCDRVIVGDIENLDLIEILPDMKFDVIAFGDVLEHLRDPTLVLKKAKEFLVEGGYVVASIPNIAHRSIRYELLMGEFRYQDQGILDRTHLRFFTLANIEIMFGEAGYAIDELRRIKQSSFFCRERERELGLLQRLGRAIVKGCLRIMLRGEAMTYQFVVKAIPEKHGVGTRSS